MRQFTKLQNLNKTNNTHCTDKSKIDAASYTSDGVDYAQSSENLHCPVASLMCFPKICHWRCNYRALRVQMRDSEKKSLSEKNTGFLYA